MAVLGRRSEGVACKSRRREEMASQREGDKWKVRNLWRGLISRRRDGGLGCGSATSQTLAVCVGAQASLSTASQQAGNGMTDLWWRWDSGRAAASSFVPDLSETIAASQLHLEHYLLININILILMDLICLHLLMHLLWINMLFSLCSYFCLII